MLAMWRSMHRGPSNEDIALALKPFWSQYTHEKLVSEIQAMIVAGSRYRNIDKALGTGSFLVLGKEISESV